MQKQKEEVEKMIGIKRYNKKWRIAIHDETFEFQEKETFEKHLKILLDMKGDNEPE